MSKEHYIKDLRVLGPDERFRSFFLVQAKDLRQNKKTGDPFLSMQLADCTGTLDARMWDVPEGLADRFNVNDFVDVHGRIQVYRERPQIIVHKLAAVPDERVALSDFMPHTQHDVEAMYAKVLSLIESFHDEDLKRLLKSIFGNPEIAKAYKRAPAAKRMHHARLGGLLEHVSSVLNLAVAVAANYEDVDRDLLIAGVLLHDLGKIYELKSDRTFEYSDAGLLLGHIPIGSAWLGRCCDEIKGFPPRLKMLLVHMVLSHHGKKEFGSPQLPAFPEAMALHFIDDLDSKLEMMRTAAAEITDGGYWSPYPKGLDGPVLDKAAYLQGAAIRSPADALAATSLQSDPERPSMHPPPAPELPSPPPATPVPANFDTPTVAAERELQPSDSEPLAPQEVADAGSEPEGKAESRDEQPEGEHSPPEGLVLESADAEESQTGYKAPDSSSAAPQSSSSDPEHVATTDLEPRPAPPELPPLEPSAEAAPESVTESGTASEASRPRAEQGEEPPEAGQALPSKLAASPAGVSSPSQAAADPGPPPLPKPPPSPEPLASAAEPVAATDQQDAGRTEPPELLDTNTDAQDDPEVATASESGVVASDTNETAGIEPETRKSPSAAPPPESVAQAAPEPVSEGVGQPKQPPDKEIAEAEAAASDQKAKPALRPEPVNRPTIVSSPSRATARPAAPPLPNPPPASSSADDNEDFLQGALFELEEPSAEYPG